MFKQNIISFMGLVTLFVVVGLLISGCSSMSQPQTPIQEPTTGRDPVQDVYPSPVTGELPPDLVVVPPPYPVPGEPQLHLQPLPEDQNLDRGQVYLDQAQILVLESYPPQFVLNLTGSLPTPCHKLRVKINEPDMQNRILIEVYSVNDPQMICVQMLQSFETSVTIANPPSGQIYTVWINGAQVGEVKW